MVDESVHSLAKDFPRWLSSANGQFTVRSAYAMRAGISFGPVEPCWPVIARYKGLPRIRTFLWLACLERVTANLTQAWKFVNDVTNWDLLFGSLVWLLWLRRNVRIFEPDEVRCEPILSQGRRLQQASSAACRSGQSGIRSLSLVNHIVDFISRGWEVQIVHVLREGNKLADGMAKIVLDSDFLCHKFLDPPDGVVSLFQWESVE
ncbi:hypothetical protein V6N11_040100 [Hibiscus sabdariffa]|uniref:RNase H type-1 domain-containing protein n=1 Tax=Hibiscus sabdariffa TaxID=183260 RepID=A0ABR2RGF8_9ROSI